MDRNASAVPSRPDSLSGAGPDASLKKPFVVPELTRYEPVQRITLVSNGFQGSGIGSGSGGTFFGQ